MGTTQDPPIERGRGPVLRPSANGEPIAHGRPLAARRGSLASRAHRGLWPRQSLQSAEPFSRMSDDPMPMSPMRKGEMSMPKREAQHNQAVGRRAAIYSRVSDQSQAEEDRTSLREQVDDMVSYCRDKGLTIVATYEDMGHGWSRKRP